MSSRPRLALVGAGNMGSHHARVIHQSVRADLAVIVDQREDVGRAVAERFGAEWAPSLGDPGRFDAVVVAAPTPAHVELGTTVLGAGVPLLLEKPLADNLADTRALIELARRGGTPLMCGLLERFNAAVMTARSIVEAPVHITGTRHSPYAPRIRTGVAWDLLVHDVDLAIGFAGGAPDRITAVSSFAHPSSAPGAEDVSEVILGFPSGPVAQLSASRLGQRKIRQMTVYELDRMIEIDLLHRAVTVHRNVSEAVLGDGTGYRADTSTETLQLIESREPLVAQFDHFLDLIEERSDRESELESILPSHVVIEQVTRRSETA